MHACVAPAKPSSEPTRPAIFNELFCIEPFEDKDGSNSYKLYARQAFAYKHEFEPEVSNYIRWLNLDYPPLTHPYGHNVDCCMGDGHPMRLVVTRPILKYQEIVFPSWWGGTIDIEKIKSDSAMDHY